MNPERVVVSAEGDRCVIYAEFAGIVIGIALDPYEAERIADDLRDRAAIIIRNKQYRP